MRVVVSEAAALDQFKIMGSAFQQAMAGNPRSLSESAFIFAGQPVRIRVVGRKMAQQILRPFSHFRSNGLGVLHPHLMIDLWDEDETNVRAEVAAPTPAETRQKITSVSPEGRFVGQQTPNSLTCYNREARHVIGSVAWNNQLSVYERGRPLDRPLLEWYNDEHIQVIHAGLVSRHNLGVLFAGKGGSGKSTSTLACLCAGFDFLSEDFVGLQRLPDGSFLGHSIYNSVFLETDHLRRFPTLSHYIVRGVACEEKSCVMLSQIFPEWLQRVAPIRMLVLPKVVATPIPQFRSASKGEALLALGPSSLLQIPNRRLGVRGFDKLAQLVERVPCYWLEIGNDLALIPRRVEELLSELNL